VLILTETELWKKSLGATSEEEEAEEFRQVLIAALRTMEDRAATLGAEIAHDLPEFPPHDASHSTAVWALVDRIAGSNLTLTPVETFVLGAAVLLHDLGMAAAAYVEGPDELRREPRWSDTVASTLRQRGSGAASPAQMPDLDEQTLEIVHRRILRDLHAEHAEKLATARWNDQKGNEYALLESPEIREALGPLIGKIAQSHWASVSQLKDVFPSDIGAPPKAPAQWTIRPLVLACLLRLADGSHLDGSRAPRFLRLLRSPEGEAALHWSFQEHLAQPLQKEDRFVFSGSSFDVDETEAWWLCADTLGSLDREFRGVDSVLADRGFPRLAIRGVVGADDPTILARYIPTHGWTPIDARVQVSNVVRLVERLGGRELYGANPEVPLRELIQNGADAVTARRALDGHGDKWGSIVLSISKRSEAGHRWLEVEDSGVGMSREVLTSNLLDFGGSFWESDRVIEEFPGLLSSDFKPTGRFGIGFFSVFMWGNDVDVISRRYDAGRSETHVLEFRGGVGKRPLLRKAKLDEELKEPGTRVRVLLDEEACWRLGVDIDGPTTSALVDLARWIAPALKVDLKVAEAGQTTVAVEADDWITMPFSDLISRIFQSPLRSGSPPKDGDADAAVDPAEDELARGRQEKFRAELEEKFQIAQGRATLLKGEGDQVVGRLAVGDIYSSCGTTVVGGLRATRLRGVTGVLVAQPTTASRNMSIPVVPGPRLTEWATEQAERIQPESVQEAMEAAGTLRVCGGDTLSLPLVETSDGPLSLSEIEGWIEARDEIWVVTEPYLERNGARHPDELHDGVVIASWTSGGLILGSGSSEAWPQSSWDDLEALFRPTPLGALAAAAEKVWGLPFSQAANLLGPREPKVVGARKGLPFEVECTVWRRPTAD
jgi:histidine kinase/DNA gyrase B/HSP90-like ATPase